MREIKLYALHPRCKDVDSTLNYLQLVNCKSMFDFVWDPISPDYLIATELIYNVPKIRKRFIELYAKSKICIFSQGKRFLPISISLIMLLDLIIT
jgi:hypothetical protein